MHLHYANFGTRDLLIRLPHGLPDVAAAAPYFGEDSLQFLKDKQGTGGILCITPYDESGDLGALWNTDELLDRLIPLRAEILDGDLRPLYLAHLALACDDNHDPQETKEAPVPAGLDKLSDAQLALAELYGLSESLIAAAARGAPSLPAKNDAENQYADWLRRQPEEIKNAWLADLLADSHSTVRREMLAEFQASRGATSWPTIPLHRTIAELETAGEELKRQADHKAEIKTARARARKLAAMAADPTPTLRETERLVALRGEKAYVQTAALLAEMRTALAGSAQAALAEEQARKLKDNNPTLHVLTFQLRRKGFVPK